ncbi:MAG: arginine deiminase family protein [Gemmatimonadota bacterium]|nr:arginine deiminase family protein [Gemmatimonadota bacterium]
MPTSQGSGSVLLALTRAVPPSIVRCELTHLAREPIDVQRAVAQHEAYVTTLGRLGCTVERLPDEPEHPDSVFVEDTAVVFDELAVIARPGAESRRAETQSVAAALAKYRELACIEAPGTLDGGDVLRVGRRVYVGVSGRTNVEGVRQLAELLAPHGYLVAGIDVRECLHLKSAVTAIADDTLLVNPRWVDVSHFHGLRLLEVHADEPFGANALAVEDTVLCAAAAPRTGAQLEARGFAVESVDVSELAKAEAGVTCCSLILYVRSGS